MDIKESNINNWLSLPKDNDYSDPYYIENGNDNYTFSDNFALKLISTIKNEI